MYIHNYDSWQGFGQLRSLINPKQLFLCGLFWVEIPRGFTFFILSTAPPSGLYCCFDIYLAAKPWRITTRYKAWRISDKSAQGLNKAVRSLSGATKTYTIFVSIAGPFSPLNTFSGIMALQERNEVNNYEHYKCGEKIWTEIWRKSGALYLASSATWLHLHLCWNALTGFGVCLYQYDRYRLSYGMAFGLVVIFISSLNAQKITNAIFRGKGLWYGGHQKRRMNLMQMLIALIGVCAAAMLLWYVYILMKTNY